MCSKSDWSKILRVPPLVAPLTAGAGPANSVAAEAEGTATTTPAHSANAAITEPVLRPSFII